MNITFQKQPGRSDPSHLFSWRLTIETSRPQTIPDLFIPELFYDYLYIERGEIHYQDGSQEQLLPLPRQSLKTLYLRPLTLHLSTPLTLYGGRFTLPFAESYGEKSLPKNTILPQQWLTSTPAGLDDFHQQLTAHLQRCRRPQNPYPMLQPNLAESPWLAAYSPRHKRRLYQATFGLSRKELDSVHNIQSFLEQSCDFAPETPRIIQHINPERFYDQAHLNHTFKKVTGLSPVAYFEANSILQDNLMAASYNATTPPLS